MNLTAAATLLRRTRRLTVVVVVLLSIQLFGNLYEELVTNVRTYAEPQPGSVGALEPGSPLFFYLPWVPIGLVLAVVLVVRLHRSAPRYAAVRGRWALACLAVAFAAKQYLIIGVNPQFRSATIGADDIRSLAVHWGIVNGIAVVTVAVALALLTSWRATLLDAAAADADGVPTTAVSATAAAPS
jgi:hypothetical protein